RKEQSYPDAESRNASGGRAGEARVRSRRCRQPVGSRRGRAWVCVPMSGIVFAEDVMSRLRERHPAYHETAYLFILSALHYVLERLAEPRHISGRDLDEVVRDVSIERFGPIARTVLEYCGIRETADVGNLVFALVDCGVLIRQADDALEDFEEVFDFEVVF